MKKKNHSLVQKTQVLPLGCLFWGLFLDHSFLVFTATHSIFTVKFLPNFDFRNMISTYSKDLPWKKMAQSLPDFEQRKFLVARLQ
jgi:hypothetical protein